MLSKVKSFIGKYIKNSQYKKNIFLMVGGRMVAQVIPILLTPLLTRIYNPEEFGVFAVYSTVVSIVSMISNARYCLAIIISENEKESRRLVLISSVLSIIVSIFLIIFLMLMGKEVFSLLNVQVLEKYIYILVLNVLFIGLFEALFYYVLRTKKYKFYVITVIIQALVLVISRIILGYTHDAEFGLIVSYLLSYFVAYILLVIHLKIFNKINIINIRWPEIKALLWKYRKFPRYSLPADILAMSTNMSPNILLNKIFGGIEAGYFALSEKILGAPLWFLTSSVGDVFRQEAAEQYRTKGSCAEIFKKTAKELFVLGFLPFFAIFLFVPLLIPSVFGPEWEPVGNYVRILTIMYFAKFVVTPVSYVNYIIGRQNYYMFFQSLKFGSILLSFGLGFYMGNVYVALISWSAFLSLAYFIIFIISYKLVIKTTYAPNN